jgi:hypothetical protein
MCENAPELFSVPVSSRGFVLMYNFCLFNPSESPRFVYRFLVVFCFELFLSGIALSIGVTMSSSGPSKENPLADSTNPYMRELKMHLKELSLKDGELQIKDVQGPKGEGSLKARMEALEQELFKYKKMAEREVDIIYRINQELVAKYKRETTEL